MSHSQFRSIKQFILRHAWLNLWDKHMTTGRINQVFDVCDLEMFEDHATRQQVTGWGIGMSPRAEVIWQQWTHGDNACDKHKFRLRKHMSHTRVLERAGGSCVLPELIGALHICGWYMKFGRNVRTLTHLEITRRASYHGHMQDGCA